MLVAKKCKDFRIKRQIGKILCTVVSAGNYWADAGAAMGVLPRALWKKFLDVDEKDRIKLELNSLLLQFDKKNILIDTGIGNKHTNKLRKIYNPSDFDLLENLFKLGISRHDINFVILTHLHFDHAGGVTSIFNEKKELTFPNAVHLIQKKDWDIAKEPDELNKASYNFSADLELLEQIGKYKLLNGDFSLTPEIKLLLVGGHSEGMQIVRIESDNNLAYYVGDIIPLDAHQHLVVTTSYDVCRRETISTKKKVLQELKDKNGVLFLPHDTEKKIIKF